MHFSPRGHSEQTVSSNTLWLRKTASPGRSHGPQAHLLEGVGIELHVSRSHDRLPPLVPVQLENAASTERAHAALGAAQID
jgi:hypothetical protein